MFNKTAGKKKKKDNDKQINSTRKVLSLLTSASFIYLETTIYEPMTLY